MAVNAHLYRLSWGGQLFVKESWACNIHVSSPDLIENPASDFTGALKAWMGTQPGSSLLSFVKFNEINRLTTKYVSQNDTNVDYLAPAFAGGSPPGPPQLTVAVSTTTGIQRGRGHAGRYFPPMNGSLVSVDANGASSGGDFTAYIAAQVTLLKALTAIIPSPGHLVVASKIGQVENAITGIKVGHVIDTQRRRRKSLDEAYTAASILT